MPVPGRTERQRDRHAEEVHLGRLLRRDRPLRGLQLDAVIRDLDDPRDVPASSHGTERSPRGQPLSATAHSVRGMAFEEFRAEVPQSELDELRRRLDATRWPDQLPGVEWSYGVELGRLREAGGRLADVVRLETVRGQAQRPPAVRHRDRRAAGALHPHEVGRCPATADARLARRRQRLPRPDRAAHAGLRSRHPDDARLRVLGPDDRDRLGCRPDRRSLGHADGAAGLRPVRRPRIRLGCADRAGTRAAGRRSA